MDYPEKYAVVKNINRDISETSESYVYDLT